MCNFTTKDLIALHMYALGTNVHTTMCLGDVVSLSFDALISRKSRFSNTTANSTVTIRQYEPNDDRKYVVEGLGSDSIFFETALEDEHLDMFYDLLDGKPIYYDELFASYTAIIPMDMAA